MTDEAVAFRSLMPISAMSDPVFDVVTKVVTLAHKAPHRHCNDPLHRYVLAGGHRMTVDEDTRIRRSRAREPHNTRRLRRSAGHAQEPGAFAARA